MGCHDLCSNYFAFFSRWLSDDRGDNMTVMSPLQNGVLKFGLNRGIKSGGTSIKNWGQEKILREKSENMCEAHKKINIFAFFMLKSSNLA